MSTTRTERTTHEGPVQLRITSPHAAVRIVASPDVTHAEVTISTPDESGPAARAVQEASFTPDGDRFEINVDFPLAAGGGLAYSDGESSVVIGSMNAGVVNLGSGNVTVQGSVFGRGSRITHIAGSVYAPGSNFGTGNVYNVGGDADPKNSTRLTVTPVRIFAVVPERSSIDIQIPGTGSVATTGQLAQADVFLNTGDTQLDRVVATVVRSNVGKIRVGHVSGAAVLTTNVGDIEVYGDEDVVVRATTNVGNIVHGRLLDIYANTNVGQVRGVKR